MKLDTDNLSPELANYLHQACSSYVDVCAEKQMALLSHSDFLSSVVKVWGSSEFVVRACIKYPEMLSDLFASGDILREYPQHEMYQRLSLALVGVLSEADLMLVLRQFRAREMLRIAWRSLASWANLKFTSIDLTALADACLEGALKYLSLWLSKDMGQPIDQFGNPAQLLVVALGKLGSQDLNFSSDIDLMFVYPVDGEFDHNQKTFQQYFIRLGQQLMRVLSAPTIDGFVFRVDMRLRPYGASGALAMSFEQLQEYYKTHGRDWERYALIKARVVTGNTKNQQQLTMMIQDFVYRQYVDFSMLESLRVLQQRISDEVRKKDLNHNIKRGPGGIREVEFICQTYKLIRGGWQLRLQTGDTIRSLLILKEMRYLPAKLADELIAAYEFLRSLENILQMHDDKQTHDLPESFLVRQQVLLAVNLENWQVLENKVDQYMQLVHQAFEEMIAKPKLQFEDENIRRLLKPLKLVWLEKISVDQAKENLLACSYVDAEKVLYLLQQIRQSEVYQKLSLARRRMLDKLMPPILVLSAQEKNTDETLMRAINVLEAVLNYPMYLALLVENPPVISQLVSLCSFSPWIAEQIARSPSLLDELLRPETLYAPPSITELKQLLEQQLIGIPEDNLEEQIYALQIFKQIHMLRVAAADITGVLSIMKVSDYLTDLAAVVVDKVLIIVWNNMVLRYGYPTSEHTDISFGIIAYGKLGGIELGYSSDLDLVFVHNDITDDAVTDGMEQIASEQFYTRLGQQILTLLSGATSAKRIYEIDMRLRPSGESGLLVPSIAAFEDYELHRAWLWEHQALVRARMISGSTNLRKQFERVREQVLTKKRDKIELQAEVKNMRERMREAFKENYSGKFSLKQGIGGITDIEFLVQYAVLQWSGQYPDLLTWTDNIRILENMGVAGLIHIDQANALQDSYRALRDAVHQLSLQNQPAWISDTKLVKERSIVIEVFKKLLNTFM